MSLLYYFAAFIALLAAGYKARDLRGNSTSPTLRAFCVTLLSLGLALLVLAPSLRPALDGLLGVPHLTRGLGNGLTLTAACAIQTVLAHFTRAPVAPPPRTRLRVAILLLAITAMAILLLPAKAPDAAAISYLAAQNPQILAYLLIYLTYLAVAMADALLMAARYARHTPSRYLRVGMRLIAAGSAVGLVYVAHKIGLTVLRYLDVPTEKAEVASPPLAVTASLLLVIGSTIGTWGPGLEERLTHWRSYRRLRPLWRALRTGFPEIVLDPALHDADERLYRRIIEIRDGQRLLRPYRDPAVAAAAAAAARSAGLGEDESAVQVEAATIAAGLRAKRSGRPPQESPPADSAPPVPLDLDAEAASLEKVAIAFMRSPLVRQALATDGTNATKKESALDDHQ
ncbi:MAG: MAB_1171c family putative transporter [Actinoallomurus sp.]